MKKRYPHLKSGIYNITVGGKTFSAVCDMETDKGKEPFIKYIHMGRGREGNFSVYFLHTSIVFGNIVYCSLTYAEGGQNLDISAYVLNVLNPRNKIVFQVLL